MMGNTWKTALVALLALAMAVGAACAHPSEDVSEGLESTGATLSILGFSAGSSTQLRADAIAEAIRLDNPDWRVTSMVAGGEARLTSLRMDGAADLFFPTSPRPLELELQLPLHPGVDFEALTDYRVVVPSTLVWMHLFAREDAGFNEASELAAPGQPYTVGCGAGIMTLLYSKLLEYYGMSVEESEATGVKFDVVVVSSAEGVEAFQSRRIDVGLTWSGLPSAHFMAVTSGVKILPISDPGLVEMFDSLGCIPAVIPADTYPFLKEDVLTVAMPQPLVARAGLPDETVYSVVKSVFAHQDLILSAYPRAAEQMTPDVVAAAVALAERGDTPYHPGALKYYREQGWID